MRLNNGTLSSAHWTANKKKWIENSQITHVECVNVEAIFGLARHLQAIKISRFHGMRLSCNGIVCTVRNVTAGAVYVVLFELHVIGIFKWLPLLSFNWFFSSLSHGIFNVCLLLLRLSFRLKSPIAISFASRWYNRLLRPLFLLLLLLFDAVTLIIVQHEMNMVDVIVVADDCILSCVIIQYPSTPFHLIEILLKMYVGFWLSRK